MEQGPNLINEFVKNFKMCASSTSPKITYQEFKEAFENGEAVLVDVREEYERDIVSVNIAKHIPMSELYEGHGNLDKSKMIVTMCSHKNRADIAAMFLNSNGYNAKVLNETFAGFVERLIEDDKPIQCL